MIRIHLNYKLISITNIILVKLPSDIFIRSTNKLTCNFRYAIQIRILPHIYNDHCSFLAGTHKDSPKDILYYNLPICSTYIHILDDLRQIYEQSGNAIFHIHKCRANYIPYRWHIKQSCRKPSITLIKGNCNLPKFLVKHTLGLMR